MKRVLLLVGGVIVLMLSACSQTPATSGAPAASVGALKLTVEAKEFSFSPAQITAKVGQTVEITMKNTGVTVHDFSIDKIALKDKTAVTGESDGHMMGGMTDQMTGTNMMNSGMDHMSSVDVNTLSVHTAADAGKSGSVTFTPTEAGEYEFFCTVPGHKGAGMVGKLIVTK